MTGWLIIGRTACGPVRRANEDHVLIGDRVINDGQARLQCDLGSPDLIPGLLLAVADGVGGEAGGGEASGTALSVLHREFHPVPTEGPAAAALVVEAAAAAANRAVLDRARSDPAWTNMGATLSGVVLWPDRFLVFHAGDSRVYRWRDGFLKTLTQDDTVTARAVRGGLLTLDEARTSPHWHTLTNCVGSEKFRLAVFEGPRLKTGDILLVCSDGLYDMVSHDDLEKLLAGLGLDRIMDSLFEAALAGGGHDNISAILIGPVQAAGRPREQ